MITDYDKIYTTYYPKLKSLVSKQIKDKDYVEDLVQEILLKVSRKLSTYNPKYAMSTWIYTIAFNTIKNYYKSLKDNITYSAEIYDNEHTVLPDNPESIIIAAETEDKYLKSLEALGDNFLQVYIMKEVEGMSMQEISEQLDVPLGTIKSRLNRANTYIKKEVL